jgi:hypothetical protein
MSLNAPTIALQQGARMTDIFSTPKKVITKYRLFEIGMDFLRKEGWKVSKIQGFGKSSVRLITKGNRSLKVSIRTSQDTWIAFPRDKKNTKWNTLSDVDVVLAVSVDDSDNPKFANVHWLDAAEVRDRFDRAYAARKAAGHSIPLGRGIWVSLYRPEADEPVNRVGGGIGLAHPAKVTVPLKPSDAEDDNEPGTTDAPQDDNGDDAAADDEEPLTIAEAKRRLAKSLGVEVSSIKITVEA